MSYDYIFKCIIVGSSGVGKSSIILQYLDKKFIPSHKLTIGVEFGSKLISIGDDIVRLQIWDTAGQENFRSITRAYYRAAAIVILVFDISNRDSFAALDTWYEDIQNMTYNPVIVLVGNKSDLDYKREISTQEAQSYANNNGMLYFEVSAANSKNVNEIFTISVTQVLKKLNNHEIDYMNDSYGIIIGSNKKNNIKNLESIYQPKKKCCLIV